MSAGLSIPEPLLTSTLTTTMTVIEDVIRKFEKGGVCDRYYIMIGGEYSANASDTADVMKTDLNSLTNKSLGGFTNKDEYV